MIFWVTLLFFIGVYLNVTGSTGQQKGAPSDVSADPLTIDIDKLYIRYGPMVLRRCRRYTNSEEDAVDAMQDVFVQVLRYKRRLQATNLSALLLTIATNVCLNRIRSRKRHPEDSDDELLVRIACAAEPGGQSIARRMLDLIFGHEPASTRTIAILHLLEGLTLEEVAEEVGLSVSGVRKRLRMLKKHVSELEYPGKEG